MFRSPPLHAAEVKCIRFWFTSRGKYYKRSLQLVVNSSDTNYSSVIWSINEENQEWTYIQLPLHENVGEVFQVINENSKSWRSFVELTSTPFAYQLEKLSVKESETVRQFAVAVGPKTSLKESSNLRGKFYPSLRSWQKENYRAKDHIFSGIFFFVGHYHARKRVN